MSALILKSGNALISGIESIDFATYKNRVLSDGGMIVNEQAVREAFAFAVSKGLGSSEVFSATSANWGVKIANGKPNKLYSLFDSQGDISVAVSTGAAIFYNTDRYNVPVIELKGSSGNSLVTMGKTAEVQNSGLCVIARTPTIASNDYGFQNFALAELSDLSPSSATADALARRIHTEFFTRRGGSLSPADWWTTYYGYGDEGAISMEGITNRPTNWVRTSSFLRAGKLGIFDNGVEVASDLSVNKGNYNTGLNFSLGRTRNTEGSGIDYTAPFYGDIAEAWCLVNTTEDKMKALSLRASQEYTI